MLQSACEFVGAPDMSDTVCVCVQLEALAGDVLTDKQKVELEELRTSKRAEGRVLLQVGSAV